MAIVPTANVPKKPTTTATPAQAAALPTWLTGAPKPAVGPVKTAAPAPTMQSQAPATVPKAAVPQQPANYRDMDWQDQLKMFQSNGELAQTELKRASNQANMYQATGDTDAYNKAQRWIGQINTATGGQYANVTKPVDPSQQRYQQYQTQMDELMVQLQSYMKPEAYNAANDPSYIAQKKLIDAQAKQRSQGAMETMNDRGILNSTITAGEIAAAEQDAGMQANVLAAQLEQQAYLRNQDNIRNVTGLIGVIGDQQQRGLDNTYREKEFNRLTDRYQVADNQWQQTMEYQKMSDAEKMAYQKARDSISDDQYKQKFDEDVRRYNLDYAIREMELANNIARGEAADSRADAALGLDYAQFDWQTSANNPDNQYKQQQIAMVKAELDQIGKAKPVTTQDAISVLNKSPFYNQTEDGITVDKKGMAQAIAGLGLDDAQLDSLFNYYGISEQELSQIEQEIRKEREAWQSRGN